MANGRGAVGALAASSTCVPRPIVIDCESNTMIGSRSPRSLAADVAARMVADSSDEIMQMMAPAPSSASAGEGLGERAAPVRRSRAARRWRPSSR
ncbi:MAG: hypothetical protein R2690_01150 [Acidimicrobiales bacterium]